MLRWGLKPKDHRSIKPSQFVPMERELVFDVDMNDFDDCRTCCQATTLCQKCWPFLTLAMKILNAVLRGSFRVLGRDER
jgi:DNA primase small subunit